MEWWQSIILGLVEGITEYLPVSSTGHLIITSDLLRLDQTTNKAALDGFEVVIQGGAILAVLVIYWARFEQLILGLLGLNPRGLHLFINLTVAFLPAAVVGILVKKYIDRYLFLPMPVIGAFIVGGVYMIVVEQWHKRRAARPAPPPLAQTYGDPGAPAQAPTQAPAPPPPSRPLTKAQLAQIGKEIDELTTLNALTIGCLQVLSMWPGTSRSMMTITGGVIVGLKPSAAAEFSFLLGMPTLLAATCLVLGKDLARYFTRGTPTMFEKLSPLPVLLGMLVAAISAFLAVKWLVGFLNKHGLTMFGVYRIVIGLVLLALVHYGYVTVAK